MGTPSTSDLIDRLTGDLTPVRPGAVPRRLALGIGGGGIAAAVLMAALLGPRADLAAALGTGAYWMKFAYTLALAAAGIWAAARLSRPAGEAADPSRLAGLAAAAMAAVAAWQLAGAADADVATRLVMGGSATVCPWLIAVIGGPVLAGMLWAMRGLAPTRPVLAGAAAGLAAGALGAWIYAFHCDESAAPFVAVWYSAGILGVAALGAVLGPRTLRW